jgi:S-adenosylmethionine decarboxylase proenzyme
MMTLLGRQFVILLEQCADEFINNPDRVIDSVSSVATDCGLHIVNTCEHRFVPQGLTVILLLSQSHLAVHTWPEHRLMTVDLFVCQDCFDVQAFLDRLVSVSGAVRIEQSCVFEK